MTPSDFLIEGRKVSDKPLELYIYQDDKIIAETSLHIEIEAGPRVALLLHGINSNAATWTSYIAAEFGGRSSAITGDMEIGDHTPNSHGISCYTLQFGSADYASGRIGLDGIHVPSDYQYQPCGDFETFDQLAQEVATAVDVILMDYPTAQIVLIGHSRGGLSGRKFLESADYAPEKAAIKGLLTVGSPNQGSPIAKLYTYLSNTPRPLPGEDMLPVTAAAIDWSVVDFLRGSALSNKHIDLRRPATQDFIQNSPALMALNDSAAIASMPSTALYGEITYDNVPLGVLSNGTPSYQVFDGLVTGVLCPPLSLNAATSVLGPFSSGDEEKALEGIYSGDGLIPGANQMFTTLAGFIGTRVAPLNKGDGTVLHADETQQVPDITTELHVLIGW